MMIIILSSRLRHKIVSKIKNFADCWFGSSTSRQWRLACRETGTTVYDNLIFNLEGKCLKNGS